MFTETITALTNRTAELQNAAETAHNAWRDSKGAPGTFDAWTEAISELTENETALALLTNIAGKMVPETEITNDELIDETHIYAKDLTPGHITSHGVIRGIYPWTSVKGQDVLTLEFANQLSQTRFPDEIVTLTTSIKH